MISKNTYITLTPSSFVLKYITLTTSLMLKTRGIAWVTS